MSYELSRLEAVAEGDQDFIVKVLQVFVVEVSEDVKKMIQCFGYKDFVELSKLAHKIKPNLILLGMDEATDSCLKIEKNKKAPMPLEILKSLLDHLESSVKEVVLELKLAYKLQ